MYNKCCGHNRLVPGAAKPEATYGADARSRLLGRLRGEGKENISPLYALYWGGGGRGFFWRCVRFRMLQIVDHTGKQRSQHPRERQSVSISFLPGILPTRERFLLLFHPFPLFSLANFLLTFSHAQWAKLRRSRAMRATKCPR